MLDCEWAVGHAKEALVTEPNIEGSVKQGVISIQDGTPEKAFL